MTTSPPSDPHSNVHLCRQRPTDLPTHPARPSQTARASRQQPNYEATPHYSQRCGTLDQGVCYAIVCTVRPSVLVQTNASRNGDIAASLPPAHTPQPPASADNDQRNEAQLAELFNKSMPPYVEEHHKELIKLGDGGRNKVSKTSMRNVWGLTNSELETVRLDLEAYLKERKVWGIMERSAGGTLTQIKRENLETWWRKRATARVPMFKTDGLDDLVIWKSQDYFWEQIIACRPKVEPDASQLQPSRQKRSQESSVASESSDNATAFSALHIDRANSARKHTLSDKVDALRYCMVSVLETKTNTTLLEDELMTALASEFDYLRFDYDDSKQLTPLMFDFNAMWSNVMDIADAMNIEMGADASLYHREMELPIRNDDGFHAVIAKAAFTPAARTIELWLVPDGNVTKLPWINTESDLPTRGLSLPPALSHSINGALQANPRTGRSNKGAKPTHNNDEKRKASSRSQGKKKSSPKKKVRHDESDVSFDPDVDTSDDLNDDEE
ncbi:hypothetical protein BCR34DRAFT_593880 [Clohesyomyces aquaticus]|uniref:Uncharacterized protein n=1 Tax=Clohesyomyces aquaticus TaxID=1231657 RepID=A0A1Y1YEC2_9PLEO|nr:hypothetical protein BCR34DRAFT_593880 [Clohesyomyces aquaticus]